MRFILAVLAVAAPAGASLLAQMPDAITYAAARVAAALPDPATAGLMFAGLGLVAGARRGRSQAVVD